MNQCVMHEVSEMSDKLSRNWTELVAMHLV